jgi:hypothetical protein
MKKFLRIFLNIASVLLLIKFLKDLIGNSNPWEESVNIFSNI